MTSARDATSLADVTVVIPTIGRPSLTTLLHSLADSKGPVPQAILVVDDRESGSAPLALELPARLDPLVRLMRSGGRGPAAARNVGWREVDGEWVSFLDDDVVVPDGWLADLATDLAACGPDVGGSQGRIRVPLRGDRPPTDAERNTAGLADAHWATADMAYRRDALVRVGGFDERFARAYREDADLALRVRAAGFTLTVGERHVDHPVRPGGRWDSVQRQRGNADDVLMRRLHGASWQTAAQVPPGRRRRHLATTALGVGAAGLAAAGKPRAALVASAGWAAATGRFAAERITPGPLRGPGAAREIATMLATSVAIPPAASWHWARGLARWRHVSASAPRAVLFDRDGTLLHDVPYNGDPDLVRPLPTARAALALLRANGVRIGVVSNQSGVGRGSISPEQLRAVNDRMERLLGPIDVVCCCPHDERDGCECRKPEPGLILDAAYRLGVEPGECVVVGDVAGDIAAARGAGAPGILVPTPRTRAAEVTQAALVMPDLLSAAQLALTLGPAHGGFTASPGRGRQ